MGVQNSCCPSVVSKSHIFEISLAEGEGSAAFYDTSGATASSGDILSGKSAFLGSGSVTGTMSNNGDVSGNIKSGGTVLGISGKSSVVDTSDATAAAGTIVSGKTAYVNVAKVIGSLTTVSVSRNMGLCRQLSRQQVG